MLFEAVNMALLDEVNEELFLIDEAETKTRKIIIIHICSGSLGCSIV